MARRCANSSCCASQHPGEGKLFRLDIDLGNQCGEEQRKTVYLWLCARCAGQMFPKVEVTPDAVRVRLATGPKPVAAAPPPSAAVN